MTSRTRHTGWLRSHSPQSQEIARASLKRVGMWELSGAQQQRVFLLQNNEV